MGDVHLNIFRYDFFKTVFRHPLNGIEGGDEVERVGESETSLGDIELTYFSGEGIKTVKETNSSFALAMLRLSISF